ncbi:MAG: hypothetical protein PHY72_00615 [Candidatus Pacebacteria bacterium]|nr:hypothetical protein [Candidatus Paceibacterota bacterium]MDD5738419.1 hypothetical protein [Candidatus Paceibacterota bacterium]
MDLSKIKKIVLEEGRVVIIDGDDALVVMSFEDYKKVKSSSIKDSFAPKVEASETKVIPAEIDKQEAQELNIKPEAPEEAKSELTLDDLPF